MTERVISRRQLHWLSRRIGANDWPFPFRAPQWPWESAEARLRAEAAVREELSASGLLRQDSEGEWRVEPQLLTTAELFGAWTTRVDLVYHFQEQAVAAAVYSDGHRAVRVAGEDISGDSDLRFVAADPLELVGALLDVVPEVAPGAAEPVRVPARNGAFDLDGPTTRRAEHDVRLARVIAESGTGMGRIGASVRADPQGAASRSARLVTFVDSSSTHAPGRYELTHSGSYATLAPATRTNLITAAQRMLADTGTTA